MEEGPPRKLAVLLHADVVGSTALVQLNETVADRCRPLQTVADRCRPLHEGIQGAGTCQRL